MRWPLVAVLALGALGALGACKLPQSPECQQYVACQEAYDATVDVAPYKPEGVCWDSPRASALCTEQCRVALEGLRDLDDPPKECESE